MSHVTGLPTATSALQFVFNLSARSSQHAFRHAKSNRYSIPSVRSVASDPRGQQPYRGEGPGFLRPLIPKKVTPMQFGPPPSKSQSRDHRPRWDEDIEAIRVYLRQENGRLSEPMSLNEVLDMRGRSESGAFLDIVEEIIGPDEKRLYPIVKICNKKEAMDLHRAKKKESKGHKKEDKSIELGWSIAENDLAHRIGRMQEFLTRGARVKVTLGSQRIKGWSRKKPITKEEGEGVAQRIKRAAMEVNGVKERAQPEGEILKTYILSFEGSPKKEGQQNEEKKS